MATLPDVTVQTTSYTDIYVTTGIAVGTSVIIQNKGSSSVYLQTSAVAPLDTSDDGVALSSLEILTVDSGELGLFAKSSSFTCKLNVQVA